MVELTLFEIHLDGAEFTANAPSIDTGSDEESADESGLGGLGSTDEGDSPNPGTAILGTLVFAVLVAVVVRLVSGGEGSEKGV